MDRFIYNKQGFSLVEVIIALGVFAILAAGVFNVATSSYKNFYGTGDKQSLTEYAQEGVEAVRSIRDNSWQEIEDAAAAAHTWGLVKDSDGYWQFSGGYDEFGVLDRYVTITPVERDSNHEIVGTGGTTDPNTYKVRIAISGTGISTYILDTYITNWAYKTWTQTDWSGDGYRDFWADPTMFSSSYSSTTTSSPGYITVPYNSDMGQVADDQYLYSSVYNLGASDKELRSLEVEQYIPPYSGCDVEVTVEASNSSNMSGAVSQVFSDISTSYYVSSTPASLNGYSYIRYKIVMTGCNTSYSPIFYSISINYR